MVLKLAARGSVAQWALSLLLLAGCGGGDTTGPTGSAQCDLESQKGWLRQYMSDAYLWSGQSPDPTPDGYSSVPIYFDALRFAGNGSVPADRWSYISDSASFSRFFEEGRTLGYGLSVNGLEMQLPLKARYVEAQSPAAAQGLVRGDLILSLNGRSAAELIAANDFSALSPAREGDRLEVQVDGAAGIRNLTLVAATYALTPVPVSRVLTLANGSKAGYLVLKDFITQAEAPLSAALDEFRAAGASDLILDLRYNGGGRVSTAATLASGIAGQAHNGKVFTSLNYSARQAARNTRYTLGSAAPGFSRVVVLSGARTCSASELLVNGLKPHLQVTTVGDRTCGKPFGFNPAPSCGSTFSAVTFEALNALGEGRYYDGIAASCPLAEDFDGALGDGAERLTAGAMEFLQTGACPAAAAVNAARAQALSRRARGAAAEPGEYRGMWAD
jgi:carboxyl-terminal processing protease